MYVAIIVIIICYIQHYLLKSNVTILHVILKHCFSAMSLPLHLAVDALRAWLF